MTQNDPHPDGERTIREEESRFKALFESAGDAIMIARVDGEEVWFTDVNNGAAALFGIPRIAFLKLSPMAISPEYQPDGCSSAEGIRKNLATVLGGERVFIQWVHRKSDGNEFPCEVTMDRIDTGNETLVLAIVRDVTERQQAQEALSLANVKISLLTAMTRHDIRNKLLVLEAYLLLMESNPESPMMPTYVKRALDASGEINRQIEFAKEYQDIGNGIPQWQDLHEVINGVAPRFDHEHIRIEIGIVSGVEIYADRMLENVFFNLIQNAVFHGKTATRISFFLQQTDEGALIRSEERRVGKEC